jgi:CRISPR-associated endoribonuclease Cas6
VHLHLRPLRFSFVAAESIHFPPGQSANILRGALGTILRRSASPYDRLFQPPKSSTGPSGLADLPRPFVFRAGHLDGLTIARGAAFHFDLNLFETGTATVTYLVEALAQLAQEGLGPGRKRVELTSVWQLNQQGEAAANLLLRPVTAAPLELSLGPPQANYSSLRVQFLTPTELKSGQQIAAKPEFSILAARARDRISTLRGLYGPGPLPLDFRAFSERASRVTMTRCDIQTVDVSRRSTRTGQVHSIGGFIGEAEYEGELTEFIPYLQAAKWTGVGRQTSWGKGMICVC